MHAFPAPSIAVLTAATAVVWFHSALLAQVQWTQQPTANSPPARRSSALVYDPVRDRTVLFGGRAPSNTLGDTWLFDGVDWVQATTPVAPGHRQYPMMTWYPVRQRVLMFGGTRLVSGSPPLLFLTDTWEWDGIAWTERLPANTPPPRFGAAFAFDAARGRAVLFGGRNNLLATHYDDTWEWDGNDWLQRAPAVRPSARRFPHAFFDEVRQRVVLTGGNFYTGTQSLYRAETWEWDGTVWTQLAGTNSPAAASEDTLVYDRARRRAVWYQGVAGSAVREWDGSVWTTRTVVGSQPAPRISMSMAFDEARGRVVCFGGALLTLPATEVAETWTYGPVVPASFASFGAGCAGAAGVPMLRGSALPWAGSTAQIELAPVANGQPAFFVAGTSNTSAGPVVLPMPLGPLGMPGCSLLVSPDTTTFAGNAGGTARWSIAIVSDPSLVGLSFHVQGGVFDPAANALGIAASAGLTATIGGL